MRVARWRPSQYAEVVRDSARAEGGVSPAGYGAPIGSILEVFRLGRGLPQTLGPRLTWTGL